VKRLKQVLTRALLRYHRQFVAVVATIAFPFALLAFRDPLAAMGKRSALFQIALATPYILLAATAYLGAKLAEKRVVFAAVAMALAYAYLAAAAPWSWLALPLKGRGEALSFALPMALGMTFVVRRGRLWGQIGALHLLALVVPAALAIYGMRAGWLLPLADWQLSSQVGFNNIPDLGLIFAAIFAIGFFAVHNRYMRGVYLFVAASLIPIYCVLRGAGAYYSRPDPFLAECALGFSGAAALVLYAVVRVYWLKVYIDELTGIPNRRALDEKLALAGSNYAVGMADVDKFKKFNDTYGHDEGDNVLRLVGSHLDRESNGRAYRYGGEEFTLFFEDVDAATAAREIDRIRARLAEREFFVRGKGGGKKNEERTKVQVTISVGVAAPADGRRDPAQVLKAADDALYRAKEGGRNRVETAPST
jgi:diguanylate cyclase (GGDEF)-like protein